MHPFFFCLREQPCLIDPLWMAVKTLMERLLELESTRTIKYFSCFFPVISQKFLASPHGAPKGCSLTIRGYRSKISHRGPEGPSTDVAVHQTATCRPGQRSPSRLGRQQFGSHHLWSAFVGDSWSMYPLATNNPYGKSLFISPILWGLLWVI